MNSSKKSDFIVMLKEAGALLAITLVAGLLLGFVYQLTKDPIAKQQEIAVQNACKAVMPLADHFVLKEYSLPEEVVADNESKGVKIGTVYEALSADENVIGYVIESTSSEGYGGNIVLYLGTYMDEGSVALKGVSILSISETAGLGMRAEEVLVPQFADKKVSSFIYTKTGSTQDAEIDAISGATITTKAVTNAVNAGLKATAEFVKQEG